MPETKDTTSKALLKKIQGKKSVHVNEDETGLSLNMHLTNDSGKQIAAASIRVDMTGGQEEEAVKLLEAAYLMAVENLTD